MCTSFSLKVWKTSPAKPSRPGLFFVDGILVTNSMPLLVVSLYRFPSECEVNLYSLCLPRNLSNSSKFIGIKLVVAFPFILLFL